MIGRDPRKKNGGFSFKMPHTYVILMGILVLTVLLTYLIPAGEYSRVLDPATGRMVVIPGSFHFTKGKQAGLFGVFLALQKGYVSAAGILFLIIFAYGYVYLLIDNGTLYSLVNVLLTRLGKRTSLLIPFSMLLFGFLGSTMGIFEETYGLIPMFVSIAISLGYDAMVGGSIVYLGVATGFAAATTNPFSVGIAQSLAEEPLAQGLTYRAIIFIVFQTMSILYVMWYAARIKRDPEKSVLYGLKMEILPIKSQEETVLTPRRIFMAALFIFTIALLLFGTMRWGWYINEIAAMFLMMMIVTGIVSGCSTSKICETFIKSTQSIVPSFLIVGFTRGILTVMQEAKISDTVVWYLVQFLNGHSKNYSALGMLTIQNIINFFITGSSSQATITMPIMVPVADLVGLSRQTATLAYIFGDGFSDLFWPTACALGCGLIGVPINKWYRFITPLFLLMVIFQVIFIVVSCFIF